MPCLWKRTVMAARCLYSCFLLLAIGQLAASTTTGDSRERSFVSKPGMGIVDPSNNLPAMALWLDAVLVSSAEECRARCCSLPSCSLAMTQDAGGAKTCYLADCLNEGVNVCELGPAPGMHSYQQEVGLEPTPTDPRDVQEKSVNSFQEYCAAPKVTGPCRAAFPRWYYDVTSSSCTKFIYGGCRGNQNNYMSKEECDQQCADRTDDSANYDPLSLFQHSTTAVVLAVLFAIMIAVLLGAMVIVFVKLAKRRHNDSSLAAVWSPVDDRECLVNNKACTL